MAGEIIDDNEFEATKTFSDLFLADGSAAAINLCYQELMNWTGGRLQQHSTSSASAKNRQRQHFAKVRQNLRHPVKTTSPIKWSTLSSHIEDSELKQCIISAPFKCRSPKIQPSQSTDQEIQSVSRRSHYFSKIKGKRCHESDLKLTSQALFVDKCDLRILKENPLNAKSTSNSELNTPAFGLTNRILLEPRKEEDIAVKRQKILRLQDWVRIGMQKPMQMKYTSTEYNVSVSRRDSSSKRLCASRSNSKSLCMREESMDKMISKHYDDNERQAIPLPVTKSVHDKLKNNDYDQTKLKKPKMGGSSGSSQVKKSMSPSIEEIRDSYLSRRPEDRRITSEIGNNSNFAQTICDDIPKSPSIFYTFSTACLRHPTPRSLRRSSLLESDPLYNVKDYNESKILNSDPTNVLYSKNLLEPSISFSSEYSAQNSEQLERSTNERVTNCNQQECQTQQNLRAGNEKLSGDVTFKFKGYSGENLFDAHPEQNISSSLSMMLFEKKSMETTRLKSIDLEEIQEINEGSNDLDTCSSIIRRDSQTKSLNVKYKGLDKIWKSYVFGSDIDD
ncbi:hypothetical protein GcM3_208031 [Golovinomyces cichoracearum]|uniref:Uncharacterized protein n=1 Tax=Golovinomyces cichoracearum TaxID=62708 RepID=A0A420HAW3_9PEZI|nr:hypothetical protein GcM3_208031 [Golovinomyces cichoracearum]